MKNTSVLATIVTAVLCISSTVFAVLSGSGTQANPYLIQSRADFDEFASTTSYWASGKYTRLMYDPNLAGTTYTKAPIAPDTSNNNTGAFGGTKFNGVFDGNGKVISNLTINAASTQDFTGLFGYVSSTGQIKNLGVKDVNVTGGRYMAGGLAGQNDGALSNCYATGLVTATGNEVGGLVGRNTGSITTCYACDSVGGDWCIGGMVGYNYGTLSNCYATGNVTATGRSVGGLVGYNGYDSTHPGTILNCHAAGNVTAYLDAAGGLVGMNTYSSVISNSYATGTVNGASKVGGLVGYNDSPVAISDCYATGEVTGTGTDYCVGGLVGKNFYGTLLRCWAAGAVHGVQEVGGLVGQNLSGSILSCYATGTVTGTSLYVGGLVGNNKADYGYTAAISNCYATGAAASGVGGVGGLIGFNGYPSAISYCYSTGTATPVGTGAAGGMVGTNQYGTYTACFWDVWTNGRGNSVGYNAGGSITGMLGKSTAEMKQQATFAASPYLWDFVDETANGTNDYWRMCVDGVNYPRLTWSYAKIGDFVCPNGVAIEDLDYYAGRWLMNNCTSANNFCGQADLNKSSTVNLEDFAILASNWLEGI